MDRDSKIMELRKELLMLVREGAKIQRMRRNGEIGFFAYQGAMCANEFWMKETMRRIEEEIRRKMTGVGRPTLSQSTIPSFKTVPGTPEGCKSAEMEEIMENVTRVPESVSGVHDGVEAMSSCAVSNFVLDRTGKPTAMKGMPEQFPCRLMASYERGTVSISAHGLGVMMTVRMEDILRIIEEACGKEV